MAGRNRDEGTLVEPEGVNACGPVDDNHADHHARSDPHGNAGREARESAQADDRDGHGEAGGPEPEAEGQGQGQGQGEMLSAPGSDHGRTRRGPGQELSAGEG